MGCEYAYKKAYAKFNAVKIKHMRFSCKVAKATKILPYKNGFDSKKMEGKRYHAYEHLICVMQVNLDDNGRD